MDYTLAIYNQPEMDELSIQATIEKLVARGYPEFIRTMPYATDFPVRGLLIDKRFGHVLKMNRYKFVTKGYHGFRELAKDELRALYHRRRFAPRRRATTGSTRSTRCPRPPSTLRWSRPWSSGVSRSTTRRRSPTSARASTRRTATGRSSRRWPVTILAS